MCDTDDVAQPFDAAGFEFGDEFVLDAPRCGRIVEDRSSDADGGCSRSKELERVAAYGTAESVRWAEQAAKAGAQCVMLLPPNAYRGDDRAVLQHYKEVAAVGLPIVAYNNPIDTKIDLVPGMLAKLHELGYIKAVKEFTGDVRRAYEIRELAPELDLMIGSDDVLLELGIAGAVGWVAGYTNAFPKSTIELYKLSLARDVEKALPLYRLMHPLLRWDSKTEFVQSIKLSMDMVGRYGGPCRPPRQPLTPEQEKSVRAVTQAAIDAGLN